MRGTHSIIAIGLATALGGCGAMGGACSGVEITTEPGANSLDAFIRNNTEEAKLVTMAIVQDGEEKRSQTVRIEAGDFFETQVRNPRDGTSIELTDCK